MDHILQALQRVKEGQEPGFAPPPLPSASVRASSEKHFEAPVSRSPGFGTTGERICDAEVPLSNLEKNGIFTHDPGDKRSVPLDFLRTQVLQTAEEHGWRVVGVTSPGPGCGKTFTALNLGISIARQPNSRVLLVDFDLSRPEIARRLGITPGKGTKGLLEGKSPASAMITTVRIGGWYLDIVASERSSARASDWLSSANVARLIGELKELDEYRLILLDLPPMLAGDDALAIIPHTDCVLMVAAAGETTATELKECAHLLRTSLLRLVLNKAPLRPQAYGADYSLSQ